MLSPRLMFLRVAVAAAAGSALVACGLPRTMAAPSADDQGYLDSAARCPAPDVPAAFGSTEASRVAICKTPDGKYEYHGVRLRDGAELIAPAALSGGVVFVAENNGISYAVSPSELVISAGGHVIRREPMVDYHTPEAPAKPTATPATTTTPTTTTSTTTSTPLPPPLPAEVGGGR